MGRASGSADPRSSSCTKWHPESFFRYNIVICQPNELVIINTEIPRRLTDEQRELMEKMAESLGTEVKPQERSILDSVRDFFMG